MMVRILAALGVTALAVAACHSGGPSYNPPNDPMMGDYRSDPRPSWRGATTQPGCESGSNPNAHCVVATH
jgi:hypothetical protein